jgi:enoyl-CoA hydratase/carnithine racemase
MTTEKGEHFCNGTDFRSILHHKKEKNYDKITGYLTDLYALQTQVAKLNKPLIVAAPGHAYNSGATLL